MSFEIRNSPFYNLWLVLLRLTSTNLLGFHSVHRLDDKRYSPLVEHTVLARALCLPAHSIVARNTRAYAYRGIACVRVQACMRTNAFALAASYLHHKASPLSWPTYPAPRRLITLGSVQITRHASRPSGHDHPPDFFFHFNPLVRSFDRFDQFLSSVISIWKNEETKLRDTTKYTRKKIYILSL